MVVLPQSADTEVQTTATTQHSAMPLIITALFCYPSRFMGRSFWFTDWWPVIAIGLLGFAGILIASITYLRSRASRRRPPGWAKKLGLLLLGVLGVVIFLAAGLILIQFGSYHTLTEWEVVSRVKCSERDKFQKFELTYTTLAGGKQRGTRTYEVYGDRWLIRADLIEWKPFMRRLGFGRSFKFTRLEGVFAREQDTLEHPLTRIQLAGGSDRLWLRLHRGQSPWPFRYLVQSAYTSTVSSGPAPGILFDIIGTRNGVALREVNY